MNILGLIPARGGSKSIPRKNIALLGGQPLIQYTAEAALASHCLARVCLSTDDPEIAQVGRDCGLEVPFLRPQQFAADESLVIDVIRHALKFFAEQEGFRPDAVMLLQPTSPFRRAAHIDQAAGIMRTTDADTVVSVVRVPHQFNPVSVLSLENGQVTPFLPGELITRRQDKPVVYARNGPAILLTRTDVLVNQNKLYGKVCRPLIMSERDSIDIDEPDDLAIVEHVRMIREAS